MIGWCQRSARGGGCVWPAVTRGQTKEARHGPSAALPIIAAEGGLTRYLDEIRKFPMLSRRKNSCSPRRWREHGDRDAAHRLVTRHLRLVAKIAMGYRGYGLPIGEVISEGNVGLMQAVKRFEPDKGFRLATYAMWWIKASIQEYILRSWSLVKMGTTANQKKLFFNLRKAKSQISALDEGDLRPDQVKLIATQARRARAGRDRDEPPPRRRRFAQRADPRGRRRRRRVAGLARRRQRQPGERRWPRRRRRDNRHVALRDALGVLNERERRIFEARRLADDPITLEELADGVRRLARARAPDRGARLREGAEGGEEAVAKREGALALAGAARPALQRLPAIA